jgi:signal transduction histidine kinase
VSTPVKSSWRTVALVVAVGLVGALGTLATAAAMGMRGDELAYLVALLVPAGAVTLAAALIARWLLMRAPLRQRFVAVALLAAVVAIANIGALSRAMFVSDHDATLLTVLLIYSAGSGVAAALVLARGASEAVGRLDTTARRLGDGDLDARVGDLGAGEELDRLARTLDDMASSLQLGRVRERDAEQMRRDLITTISHDLRTPLASLRAMVEAVDEGVVDDTPSLRRYAGEMRRSLEQLATMVDDLFELTQLDVASIQAETRRARLDHVVRSAVVAVELQAADKGLALVQDLGRAEDVACSPRVARVLQNLLANAVRHTPADGTVTIEAGRDGDLLHLSVEDTGEGMTPEDLTRVFEPFFRADPARSGPGAGLGLALAKRIVEALGGRISAESRPQAGSRFHVELPV